MKSSTLIVVALLATVSQAWAFPPAPPFTYFGTVRDETGRPLGTGQGIVIVSGPAAELTRSTIDITRGVGVNYAVNIPLDANTTGGLYQVSALRPAMPFTIRVLIEGTNYVPTQMAGRAWTIGKAGTRERLDLTLGIDSDGDGLPDSWEQSLIDTDPSGRLRTLADVKAGDDSDGDGLSNLTEYHLGTYALDKTDGLTLDIKDIVNGKAHLQFAVVTGRTYSLTSSSNLTTWTAEPLLSSPAATASLEKALRAADTTLVDVYVPLTGRSSLTFRLHGQ
jgi:Bacterial TSP3 repeat